MTQSLKQVLMVRDEITSAQADELISEAREELTSLLEEGNMEDAENICYDYFGLEPDYLIELI